MGSSQSPGEALLDAAQRNDVNTMVKIKATVFSTKNASKSSRGAPPPDPRAEWQALLNTRSRDGFNAILVAAAAGALGALRWLLENGADPNSVDSTRGDSVLHTVVRSSSSFCRRVAPQAIGLLLERGAEANRMNLHAQTPVIMARLVHRQAPNAAQILRTLEMSCSLVYGELRLQEHGDFAKLAGSLTSMFSGKAADGRGTQDQITQISGGVYKPRWCVLITTRASAHPEMAIYGSMQDTHPIAVFPASTVSLGEPRNPGQTGILGLLGGPAPGPQTARFRLNAPVGSLNMEATRVEYARWNAAFAWLATQGPAAGAIGQSHPMHQAPQQQQQHQPLGTGGGGRAPRGAAENFAAQDAAWGLQAGAGGGARRAGAAAAMPVVPAVAEPVHATPLGPAPVGAGASPLHQPPLAEAVVLGPAVEPVQEPVSRGPQRQEKVPLSTGGVRQQAQARPQAQAQVAQRLPQAPAPAQAPAPLTFPAPPSRPAAAPAPPSRPATGYQQVQAPPQVPPQAPRPTAATAPPLLDDLPLPPTHAPSLPPRAAAAAGAGATVGAGTGGGAALDLPLPPR